MYSNIFIGAIGVDFFFNRHIVGFSRGNEKKTPAIGKKFSYTIMSFFV